MRCKCLHCVFVKIFEYYKRICTTVRYGVKLTIVRCCKRQVSCCNCKIVLTFCFTPHAMGIKVFFLQNVDKNAFDACIQQKYVLQYYYHKECARDSPFDRTATCFCKVPKAERWGKQIYSPSDDGLFLLPLCGIHLEVFL